MPVPIRAAVRRMADYKPPQEGRRGLRLDFNENTTGCSPRVLEALHAATAEDLARYPEYREAEAEITAAFGHSPATGLLTNGVDDAILLAVLTVVDSGDEVVVVEPTFAMYRFYGEQAGASLHPLRYLEREVSPGVREFVYPAAAVREAVTARTRAIFVASPNNPTGTLAPAAELLRLAQEAPDCLVFVDEAYAEFVAEDYAGLLGAVERQPNLVVARTFSKAYGMAGARLGCLFAHPSLLGEFRRAHSPYNVNALAALCGRAAVADRAWVEDYRRQAIAGRARIEATLTELGLPWWRSAANFVLFDAGVQAEALLEGLRARGILIRDRRHDVAGALRITCGTLAQTEQACAALRELARELRI